MNGILNIILYAPLGWILSTCYSLVSNYGIALLMVSVIIRLLLFPSTIHQQKGMAKNARMQAKVARLRKKYATNPKKLQEETNALYQREGMSSMTGGCLPMLVQFPIIIGLYRVVYRPFTYIAKAPLELVEKATEAVKALPANILEGAKITTTNVEVEIFRFFDHIKDAVPGLEKYYNDLGNGFFHVLGLDLSQKPEFSSFGVIWIIPILAGLTAFALSFYQMKKQKEQNPEMAKSMGCMNYTMPLVSFAFCFSLPAAVGFYWICTNLVMLAQTLLVNRFYPPEKMLGKVLIQETVERRSKENMRKSQKTTQAAE